MRSDQLALHGGQPAIAAPLELFNSMGEDEARVAADVVRSGVLSAYIGAAGNGFLGGTRVRAFEAQAASYFGVRHAITVNSWTSGLIAAVGALGIEPGDEIITTPWTMAASATAILHFNGIPVFADIDRRSFNIDPAAVEAMISNRTRAIMAVDIFGQSADMTALRAVAARHGLKIISDTAQAPGARYGGKFAGTLADIGGYSLNYHKHIHCGEGGVLVTDDDRLADRVRLIRNHAEAVVDSNDPGVLTNLVGYNFRLGEIESAIASVQLTKLAARVASRQRAASQLTQALSALPGLATPQVIAGGSHVYYVYGLIIDDALLRVPRHMIVDALKAEGVPGVFGGYQNLHQLPMFRNKIAFGSSGFPWTAPFCTSSVDYSLGTLPIAEELHRRSFIGLNLCMCEFSSGDVDQVIAAFRKVWGNLDALRARAA